MRWGRSPDGSQMRYGGIWQDADLFWPVSSGRRRAAVDGRQIAVVGKSAGRYFDPAGPFHFLFSDHHVHSYQPDRFPCPLLF